MFDNARLNAIIATYTGHRYARWFGRGTTALYIAFRALATIAGPGEIVLPDLICSTVLDALLLAGHMPVFADVLPGRWTLDPLDARRKITKRTRAVLVSHLFGHVADVSCGAFSDLGVPIVEDAIQGLGADVGRVGRMGEMTVVGFAESKMIGGRGAVLLTNDPDLAEVVSRISIAAPLTASSFSSQNERLRSYRRQLQSAIPDLLRPFDEAAANIAQIEAGWYALAERVSVRNEHALYLADRLAGTTLHLAAIRPGDAVWRFTFAAPTVKAANWIARHLQHAGLPGSRLYPSLSTIFEAETPGGPLWGATIAPRLVNLWVGPSVNRAMLDRALTIVRSAPGVQLTAGV